MNRGSDSILSVYSDARAEYTKQLCVFLVPAYFQFFIDLLEKSKQSVLQEPKKVLWQFQNYLNEIHDWNMEKVNYEIHTIYTNCGCDYLEDLLTAVFIAHTKVLTAIRLSSNNKKVEINIPKVEHFLFKVLCETSKLLWSSTYLFRDGIPGIERQQNYRNIEGILNEGILQAVRSLVPVRSILKDFVTNDSSDNHAEEDSDEETEKKDDGLTLHKSPPSELTLHKTTPSEPISLSDDIPITSSTLSNSLQQVISHKQESIKSETSETQVSKEELLNTSKVEVPQTIIIEDKPTVRFGQFDTVFGLDHPSDSEMLYDPKDGDDSKDSDGEEQVPDLEIMDENGIPLSETLDFDDLNTTEEMSPTDYEEL